MILLLSQSYRGLSLVILLPTLAPLWGLCNVTTSLLPKDSISEKTMDTVIAPIPPAELCLQSQSTLLFPFHGF